MSCFLSSGVYQKSCRFLFINCVRVTGCKCFFGLQRYELFLIWENNLFGEGGLVVENLVVVAVDEG